jgi:hypothetical protein
MSFCVILNNMERYSIFKDIVLYFAQPSSVTKIIGTNKFGWRFLPSIFKWEVITMIKSVSLKRVGVFLLACGTMLLCACGKQSSTTQTATAEQTGVLPLYNRVAETENGLLFFPGVESNRLFYWDTTQNLAIPLCGKADCEHSDETCNAYFENSDFLSLNYYQGHIYLTMIGEKHNEKQLVRVDADGSNRQVMCQIEAENDEWISPSEVAIYNDTCYMLVSTNEVNQTGDKWALYSQPINGKSKATCIYAPQDDEWLSHQFADAYIYENKLYFQEIDYRNNEENALLYQYDLTNGELTLLLQKDHAISYTFLNDHLYYQTYQFAEQGDMAGGEVFCIDLSTGEETTSNISALGLSTDNTHLYTNASTGNGIEVLDESGAKLDQFDAQLSGNEYGSTWRTTPSYIIFYQDETGRVVNDELISPSTWHLYKTAQIGENGEHSYLEFTYDG